MNKIIEKLKQDLKNTKNNVDKGYVILRQKLSCDGKEKLQEYRLK